FDCATLSIIGHALPLSTITRAALATPHCVDAGTRTGAPSAVSQTDSLQWHASSCNDRLCLTLISARPPHHKAALSVPSRQPMFLSSTTGPFLRPDLPAVPKSGRQRSDSKPAHHPEEVAHRPDTCGLPPAALFACQNGRKSHHPQPTPGAGTKRQITSTPQPNASGKVSLRVGICSTPA